MTRTRAIGGTAAVLSLSLLACSELPPREGLLVLVSPVYGFCAALDAVFFNAVEFWSGDCLITDSAGTVQPLDVADAGGPCTNPSE